VDFEWDTVGSGRGGVAEEYCGRGRSALDIASERESGALRLEQLVYRGEVQPNWSDYCGQATGSTVGQVVF